MEKKELKEFFERFKELVNEVGSCESFGRLVGIPGSTIRTYFYKHYQPTVDKLQKIARATGVNLNWLLLGEGPKEKFETEFVLIPRIDVKLGAGGEVEVYDAEPKEVYAFRKDWLLQKGDPKDMRLMTVVGDSMEPTLYEGDIVLVDLSKKAPSKEGIYALRIYDGLVVKRLQRLSRTKLRVISDNPKYPPQEVDLEGETNDFAIIGRVVWMGREL